MKTVLFVLVSVALAFASATHILTPEQQIEETKFKAECIAETKVSPDVVANMEKQEYPEIKDTNCYNKCMALKYGVMNEAGEFFIEKIKAKISKEHLEKHLPIIEKCLKDSVETDSCAKAYEVFKCKHPKMVVA